MKLLYTIVHPHRFHSSFPSCTWERDGLGNPVSTGCAPVYKSTGGVAMELPGQVHSQVQLGNGEKSAIQNAFTLIEMLVAMSVLVLLVVLIAQLFGNASAIITGSGKHMDSDSQARMIFDRMANDFSKMVRRKDVDYIFYKNTASTSGKNDAMFFYSEAPSYADPSLTATTKNSVALVGYRIALDQDPNDSTKTSPQLERLGELLKWDGNNTTKPGGMVFLSYPGATPDPKSTLDGNWSVTLSSAANGYTNGTDTNYHVVGDQVYRLELAFILTDGTTSAIPILSTTPSTWSGNSKFYTSAGSAPTASADSTQNPPYAPGSRWYDTTASRGYICISTAAGAAVWSPIGIQDISAVIVAIAILDNKSRKIVPSSVFTTSPSPLVSKLADPTAADLAAVPPKLMAQTWTAAIEGTTFASLIGIPQSAASQIRIYQRTFYLNNFSNQ